MKRTIRPQEVYDVALVLEEDVNNRSVLGVIYQDSTRKEVMPSLSTGSDNILLTIKKAMRNYGRSVILVYPYGDGNSFITNTDIGMLLSAEYVIYCSNRSGGRPFAFKIDKRYFEGIERQRRAMNEMLEKTRNMNH